VFHEEIKEDVDAFVLIFGRMDRIRCYGDISLLATTFTPDACWVIFGLQIAMVVLVQFHWLSYIVICFVATKCARDCISTQHN